MAKYKHLLETQIVLEDILNRLIQLEEANERFKDIQPELVQHQNTALQTAQMVVQQAIDNGHVFRGSDFVPDGLLPYVKTPSPQTTLISPKEEK